MQMTVYVMEGYLWDTDKMSFSDDGMSLDATVVNVRTGVASCDSYKFTRPYDITTKYYSGVSDD